MTTESTNSGNQAPSHHAAAPVPADQNAKPEVVIAEPPSGQTYQVAIDPSQRFVYDFTKADIQGLSRDGDDVTVHFTNNSNVVLKNYAGALNQGETLHISFADPSVASDFTAQKIAQIPALQSDTTVPPTLNIVQTSEAQDVIEKAMDAGPRTHLAQIDDVQHLAQIEPAAGGAGGGAGGHGYGFQSSFVPQGVIPLSDVGPINPTALQYGAQFPDYQVFLLPTPGTPPAPSIVGAIENLDETNLAGGPLVEAGQINVNFGGDGPGTIDANGAFSASGSLAGGVFTSGGFAVAVTSTAHGYEGIANGHVVFTLTVNEATGEFVYTQYLPFDHADGSNPNDVISLEFGINATDADGDTVSTSILVNVADDAPSISGSTGFVDEDSLNPGPAVVSGSLAHSFGADGAGTVSGTGAFSAGGSELGGHLTSHGVAVVVSYNAATGTYTGQAGAQTVFTLHINADGTYSFTLLAGLDHADPNNANDIINLNFGAHIVDFDGDSANTTITINVADSVPTIPGNTEPTIGHGLENVDETNLGPITVSGTLPVNFGGDTPGHVNGNGSFSAGGSELGGHLTSHGVAVVVSYNAATGTYTGAAGANTIFTLHVNNDGSYSFTLIGTLDHADGNNPNDVIALHFGVTATDADGDTASGQITVNVADDGPSISGSVGNADESDLNAGPVFVNGSLAHDFGHDGAGTVSGNNTFSAGGSLLGGNLTSHGIPVNVTYNAATETYTGVRAGGLTVFTLHINADGTYNFTLVGGLDHADPNNPNDIISLNFGAHIVDFDGDSANTTITINVADSVPSIPGNTEPTVGHGLENVDETNLGPVVVSGTLPVNFGGDTPGHVGVNGNSSATGSLLGGQLTSHGVPVSIVSISSSAGGGGYTGIAGGNTIFTLHVNADGSYTFTLLGVLDHANGNDPNDVIALHFGVTATDADGDTASGQITVNVADDAPSISGSTGFVDEDSLNPGPAVVSGSLAHSFGADGAGTVSGTGAFSAGGSELGGHLTSHGVAVVVSYNAATGTYTGQAGAQTVFTLHINADGTYSFTLLAGLDHADPNNANDIINLNFGAHIVDFDGDSANTTITINVADSVPTIPGNTEPTIGHGLENVDETNLGPITVSGTLPVNFGGDTPGHVNGNGSFSAGGSELGGHLTSHGVAVVVSYNAATGTYTGAAGANTIFTLHVNNDGSYSFTLIGTLDHADGNNPNDVIALHFGVTATDADGDTASGQITVNVADDAPHLGDAPVVTVREVDLTPTTTVNGALPVNFGADGAGHVDGTGAFSASGSVLGGNLTSHGVAVVVTYNPGTNTYTGQAGAQTVFTLHVNADGTYSFTLQGVLDHADPNNPHDVINLHFGAQAIDGDGDISAATITVNVVDNGPIIIPNVTLTVDETDLGPVVVNGHLQAVFGPGETGTFSGNGDYSADTLNGKLTSHGFPVVVTSTPTGYVGVANGQTIFTLHINADGTYSFTLSGVVDHPDHANPNDVINLHFGFNATDMDGDVATGNILVHVNDDGPSITFDAAHAVNESDLHNGPVVVNGDLIEHFGADGPGAITPNGSVQILYQVNGESQALTSHGIPVVITETANGYTATAGGTTVFTLTINPLTGAYTYTQFAGVDHHGIGQTGIDDTIWIKLGVNITDYDGDSASSFVQIDLRDDGPMAVNDVRLVTSNAVTGNVVGNDSFGADGPGGVHSVTYNGTVYTIAPGQTITINGHYGVLQISSDGNYTYTSSHTGNGSDVFTYGIHDYDGDSSSANLTLNVNNPPTVTVVVNNGVDDAIVKEDHSIHVNAHTSVTGGAANDVLTLTLTGVNPAWGTLTLPTLAFSPAGSVAWVATGTPGEYKLTLPAGVFSYNADFIFTPHGDSDIDLSGLKLTASLYDPATGSTTTSQDSFNVIVDAVVDAPTFQTHDIGAVSWDVHQPHTVPLSIFAQVGDMDGSEQITKIIINLNNQFTNGAPGLNSLEDMGVGLNMGVEVSPGIWEIQVHNGNTTAALQGLALTVPASDDWRAIMQDVIHDGHNVNIGVTAVAAEVNTHGAEPDLSDNQVSVVGNIAIEFWLTPLVLDLNGDGINIVNQDAGVMFDMNNNGTLDHTSWVGPTDGFLAIDLNHDGVINNQSELFGNTAQYADGFANLASYDSNGDGRIDAQDAAFNDLRVWQDLNQDGISQSNELFKLSDVNIVAINLNAAETGHQVGDAWISSESTFEYGDGRVNVIGDAWFHVDDGNGAGATLEGSAGRDIVYGTTLNDIIIGHGGEDTLYGRGGDDTFVFQTLSAGIATIKDFNAGDKVDVSALLQGFDPAHSDIHNYVFTTIVDGNTVISIDITGSGDASHATTVAILEGVTGMSVEDITGYHAPQNAAAGEASAIEASSLAYGHMDVVHQVDPAASAQITQASLNHDAPVYSVHPNDTIPFVPPVHETQAADGTTLSNGLQLVTDALPWIPMPVDTHGSDSHIGVHNVDGHTIWQDGQSPPIFNLPNNGNDLDKPHQYLGGQMLVGGGYLHDAPHVFTVADDELQSAINAFISKPHADTDTRNVDGHQIWHNGTEHQSPPIVNLPATGENEAQKHDPHHAPGHIVGNHAYDYISQPIVLPFEHDPLNSHNQVS